VKFVAALCLILAGPLAHAAAWTSESHGALCVGSSCNNTAPDPPTIAAGRVLIVYSIHVGPGTATLATPSGWVRLDPTTLDADNTFNTRVFCKVAVGGDAMPTLDWGSSTTIVQQALSFSGPTAPDCASIVHASLVSEVFGVPMPAAALTITHTNTLVLQIEAKLQDGTPLDYTPITCPTDVNTGQFANDTQVVAFWPQVGGCYRVETTASSTSADFTPGDSEGSQSVAIGLALERQDAANMFTSGPTVSGSGTTTFNVNFTASMGATIKCGAWLYGTVPSGSDVNSATNAHGNFTVSATGSSQNVTLTTDGTAPVFDVYCTPDAGVTVTTRARTFLNPATGKQFTQLTTSVTAADSIPAIFNAKTIKTIAHGSVTSGPFTVGGIVTGGTSNAYGLIQLDSSGTLTVLVLSGTFQNGETLTDNHGAHAVASGAPASYITMALNDVLVDNTTVSPSAAPLSVTTDGQFSYDNGATGRQIAAGSQIYDVSAQQYATIGFDFVDHNATPNGITNPALEFVFKTGVAITPVDLKTYCADGDNDALTFGRVGSVALPAGLALTYAGVMSGTPTVPNLSGAALTILCLDPYQAYFAMTVTVFPVDFWPMPNCVGLTVSACLSLVVSSTHGSITLASTRLRCSHLARSLVSSQSPAAAANIAPGATFTLTASKTIRSCAYVLGQQGG
jgi:hypothetical protein